MKYVILTIIVAVLLVVIAPYFVGETGPHTIACSYSRIVRSHISMLSFTFGGAGRTPEQIAHDTATDPKCRR